MEALLDVSPDELTFYVAPGKSCTSLIHLRSQVSERVAFKVKTNNARQYFVKPNQGVLRPMEELEIIVRFEAVHEISHAILSASDKFLIQTTRLVAGDLTTIWDTQDKSEIFSKKLKAVLVQQVDATQPQAVQPSAEPAADAASEGASVDAVPALPQQPQHAAIRSTHSEPAPSGGEMRHDLSARTDLGDDDAPSFFQSSSVGSHTPESTLADTSNLSAADRLAKLEKKAKDLSIKSKRNSSNVELLSAKQAHLEKSVQELGAFQTTSSQDLDVLRRAVDTLSSAPPAGTSTDDPLWSSLSNRLQALEDKVERESRERGAEFAAREVSLSEMRDQILDMDRNLSDAREKSAAAAGLGQALLKLETAVTGLQQGERDTAEQLAALRAAVLQLGSSSETVSRELDMTAGIAPVAPVLGITREEGDQILSQLEKLRKQVADIPQQSEIQAVNEKPSDDALEPEVLMLRSRLDKMEAASAEGGATPGWLVPVLILLGAIICYALLKSMK
ncbi:Vesicle-associated protein 1-2 [Porphyridium purpureum]|uniref:Vesicle-associated protein 1-2 n=1 Tax=Porphyridium purpureum TaxID=35688 RepID=A0A5J4YKT7_PORPP|nr:Vesicle-associated protein 1-2 [Porphyridium purpureum]|eukprot:POR7630..scf210_14